MKLNVSFKLILLLFVSVVFYGCDKSKEDIYTVEYSNKPAIKNQTYIFGIHPLHNPKRLFEVYQPLVDYLNSHLKDVKIVLEASTNYAEYDKKLFSGHFDFSLPNPYQTVQSTEHGYVIFGKMGDDHNFKGIILVRKDSGIKKVSDLKGKSVSYPAPTALAATMMPQRFLHDNGIDINKDIKNLYVGSQESSIMNVFLKESAAAATWPPPWIAFIKERPEVAQEVEIIWETEPLPNNGLVARNDIDPVLVNKIASLIFNLHLSKEGQAILKPMELSRFEKADDTTYESVRVFLEKFEKEIRPIRLNNDK
jgi:phosphonate transport system substrate-binding protein